MVLKASKRGDRVVSIYNYRKWTTFDARLPTTPFDSMKKIVFTVIVFLISLQGFSKDEIKKSGNKGKFYLYWGWNRATYSNSDINFSGNNYNFTLDNVIAKDRQSPVDLGLYLNPATVTIPQVNYRLGYFFKEIYSLSIGVDHMKYVVVQDQVVNINGSINESGTEYDGVYQNEPIAIKANFLMFEHTDGLNYINLSLRRHDNIYSLKRIGLKHGSINTILGVGSGILLPRTNTTLLKNERYDEFHLSGFGLDLTCGVNITLGKWFFIQSELKGGFIDMPDIRTTQYSSDKAKQYFGFVQANIIVGASFRLTAEKE